MIKYFYCEECKKIHRATIRENIYYTDKNVTHSVVYWYRCECGMHAVEIDTGMVNIIKTLNEYGLTTMFCCEGHLKTNKDYQPAYITFDTSITKELFEPLLKSYPLPNGWEVEYGKILKPDSDTECVDCVSIYYTGLDDEVIPINRFQSLKIEYLNKLMIWVLSLYSSRMKSSDKSG